LKKRRRLTIALIAATALILVSFACYLYAGLEGLPWKHSQVKREAVEYMKSKYNMDVRAAGSSYNFKFGFYTAEVYDVRDPDRRTVRVERHRYKDGNTGKRVTELEDNYGQVYWEPRLSGEFQEKYASFARLEAIDSIRPELPYSTTAMNEGVSPEKDESGVSLPAEPTGDCIWNIELATAEFPDEFLEALLAVKNEMAASGQSAEFVVFGKREAPASGEGEGKGGAQVLHLSSDRFGEVNSVEDLRSLISEN